MRDVLADVEAAFGRSLHTLRWAQAAAFATIGLTVASFANLVVLFIR